MNILDISGVGFAIYIDNYQLSYQTARLCRLVAFVVAFWHMLILFQSLYDLIYSGHLRYVAW